MAYCKIHLYAQLLESDLPEDPYLAHDLERYFPPPLPERYSQRDALAPAAPRDHRDRRRQPARRSRRHHVRLPARRGDRRAPVDTRARVRGRARGVRHALVLGGGRGARQPGRSQVPAGDADRGTAPGRARNPLAGAREPARDRHRAGDRALRAGGQADGAGAARRARRRRSRGVRQARRGPAQRRRPRGARRPGGRHALVVLGVRHRRGCRVQRARPGHGDDGLRRPRLPGRAQLAARPDHRAAAHQPLAGAGARCAARGPLRRAPIACPGGDRGGRGSGRRRGGDRRLG